MDVKTKKIAASGLSSFLLVAMVVAVAAGVEGGNPVPVPNSGGTTAVHAICTSTDYKKTCEKSLASTNSSDPQELIKVAFNYAIDDIQEAIKNSTLYKQAAADPRTKGALEVCEEVLDTSVEDLRRSFDRVGNLDMSKLKQYIEDVKTWLSGAITNHETCLDTFQNTTGDTGEKMKNLLHSSGMMLSNGLAMVGDISSVFSSLSQGVAGFFSGRLLAEASRLAYGVDQTDSEELKSGFDGKFTDAGPPPFVDAEARRMMTANVFTLKPNIVVAQDGSGQFRTINDAIKTFPKKSDAPIVIHVKAGFYKENVILPKKVNNVVLIGDGPLKTRISGSKNYVDGTQTFHSATLAVNADGFIAKDIAIENTAGPLKHQAVAVRVSGDKAIFFNVHMYGFQDTLYAHTYRQYYRDCTITGTIDFIFGDAAAVFQNCHLLKAARNAAALGATVLQDCHIMAEPAFINTVPPLKAYLGRPWKEFSRTIIMQTLIDGFIAPEGWSPWQGNFALDTLYYGEYKNCGPGSDLSRRVRWRGIQNMNDAIAQSFTPGRLFAGDEWVTQSAVPYVAGMVPPKKV
ncbi:putative pectinesterase/pectinesterase inhibitor 28 [Sesamum alatum]|uniref:Pectinesterase n=1 Tax=Sesamum alatum TaxID=300844 RepID=A0AAE2CL34_9LAMI|nr:putative pectinesterase/pectinesterase inhibitor 28 [Sesamum alatum]